MIARALGLALALLVLGGCGKNDFVLFYEDMVEQVCACKDLRCVDDVNKATEKKIKAMGRNQDGSYDDKKAIDAASARRAECIRALEAAGKAGK